MTEVDTTGAGKTLDKLTAWWTRHFGQKDFDELEWSRLLASFYGHEKHILDHLRSQADSPYPFLRDKVEEMIARQETMVEVLKTRLEEIGAHVPELASPASKPVGSVPFSFDLHEIHDMYNAYIFHHSVAEQDSAKALMTRLISEKKWQEEQLFSIVTKIHT